MESILLLLILAPTALFLIFKFDTRQNRKIGRIVKDTKHYEPLFLMRATEHKLKELNTQLYGNITLIANGSHSGRINMNESARQILTTQLSKLISEYNSGILNLKQYNAKLGEILQSVNQVRYMNFEQIKLQVEYKNL